MSHPTSPLQPVVYNFNAAAVASWIPRDNSAIRDLIGSLMRDKVLVSWYKEIERLLFGTDESCLSLQENISCTFQAGYSSELDLVDLSLSEDIFSKISALGLYGLNLDNILRTYFGSFEGTINKLVLPDYRHVAQFSLLAALPKIRPRLVKINGVVPLPYLVDVMRVLAQTPSSGEATHGIRVLVKKLDIALSPMALWQHAGAYTYLESQLDGCPGEARVKAFVQDVCGLQAEEALHAHAIKAMKSLSSAGLRQVMGEGGAGDESNALFYSTQELRGGSIDDDSLVQCGSEGAPDILKAFLLAKEVDSFLTSKTRLSLTQDLPSKVQESMKALLKGYHGAVHLLQQSSLGDAVSSLDLRMDDLQVTVPEIDIASIGDPKWMLLTMPKRSLVTTSSIFEDDRVVSLSGVFRALSIKSGPDCEIQELVLPPVQHLDNIEETFKPNIWKKCLELNLTGTTRLDQLIQILKSLPKGEYPMNIHVPNLKMCSSLPSQSSRDFDSPTCVNVIIYRLELDRSFFAMSNSMVKTVYEICLKLSSVALLKKLKDYCQAFLEWPAKYRIPYNSVQCYEGCRLLQTYLEDALDEDIISDDDSMLLFANNVYKYQIMSSTLGRQRFPGTFKPPSSRDDALLCVLPTNLYKQALTKAGVIMTALTEDKIRNATVAVFGLGINAFHREFFTSLSQVKKSEREAGCSFGDRVIGMAFNVVPEETMAAFLDENGSVGTTVAALVAGATCGAAPFANIVSIKIGTVSGSIKPKWVIEGIQWLLKQESQGALPPSDVILFPFTFGHFNQRLYRLVNRLCSAGKVVVCAAGKSSAIDEHRTAYPAAYGDVLCVGSHSASGETSMTSGKGREIDFTALGEVTSHQGLVSDKWCTALAAAQVAGLVAYTLMYSELIGGPKLRQAISNNSVMRETLRQMCTKPGQHDERSGHGCLNPNQIFQRGTNYFKKVVSNITEEYHYISSRQRAHTWNGTTRGSNTASAAGTRT